jgi:hypothetical protein
MTARRSPKSRPALPKLRTPSTRMHRTSTGFSSAVVALLLWITIVAFASPAAAAGVGTFGGSVAHSLASPLAVKGAPEPGVGLSSAMPHSVPSVMVPGSDPAGQSFQNAPLLAAEVMEGRSIFQPSPSLSLLSPSPAPATPGSGLTPVTPGSPVTSLGNPGSIPPAVPTPESSAVPTGTVIGTVEQSTTSAGLGGVAIQAYSGSGLANCPIKTCAQVTSTSNGSFSVTAPVGADYVQFSLSFNLTNITYCTVVQGLTTSVGVVYLVPEAVLTGIVEANTSSHPKLPGTSVTAVSDDNTLFGQPVGASNSQGAFTAGLPPVPSIVTFSPPFGYQSTFLFETAAPGQHLDIGVVYVQKDPVVEAQFYDAVTGQPISGSCTVALTTQCNAITVCSAITPSDCGQQGAATGASTVVGVGPAGNDYVKAWATGYVTDSVYIGHVGYNSGTLDFGRIYLTPEGVGELTVQITKNSSTVLPKGWAIGQVYVSICSMDGLDFGDPVTHISTGTVNVTSTGCLGGCAPPLAPFEFPALPLRILIRVTPDSNGNCFPTPSWPIAPDLPVFGNQTWINVTPDEVTSFDTNLSVGDYVAGNVSVPGGAVPSDFTVTPSSIDNANYASYTYSEISSGASPCSAKFAWDTGPGAFCVAVPPGASKLTVQTSTSPYEENFTWGSAPTMCCAGTYPMTLSEYTSDHATSINLSSLGNVYGHVAQVGTGQGVFFASYSIEAAGTNLNAPTFTGAVALNGTIYSAAPFGWDSVTVSASGFAANTVWVNVSGNDSFGTVLLTTLATIAGRVVDPDGNGLLGASVFYCSIVQTSSCSTPLGAGLATTGGGYNGTVPGLWLPYTTYEIYAVSAGYTPDWTWVNTSAGQVTIAPTLVLYPVTQSARGLSLAPSPSAGTNPLPETYLRGYLVDNSTGEGLATGGTYLQACSTATGTCFSLLPGSNSQGLFNATVPLGTYELNLDPPGYQPVTRFVNASSGALQYLGVIQLYPLPWVSGRVAIDPFGAISVIDPQTDVPMLLPLAPAAVAQACDTNSSICGASLAIESNGSFTVQTPAGSADRLEITPSGGSAGPSVNGGFDSNQSTFNASANTTTVLNTTLQLAIYVMVGGIVLDNTSTGPGGISPWLFLPGATVTVSTFGPTHTSLAYSANQGGEYLMFVPPMAANLIAASATITSVFTSETVTATAALPETLPPRVFQMPTLGLVHFGWVQAEVMTPNGTPAQFLAASTYFSGAGGGSGYSGLGSTNAWGQLNATAPPGTGVQVSVGPANDYNTTFAVVDVNASATTYVGGGTDGQPGLLLAAHWGWVLSAAVNASLAPIEETVLDQAHQAPLPGAEVKVTSSDTTYAGSGSLSNWQGQYVTDAPIGPADTLSVTRSAAIPNTTALSIAPGQTRVQSVIDLTGVGVLVGQVVAYPSGLPVAGASVQACPTTSGGPIPVSGCYTATTNASGDYWVPADPGQVTVETSASGYVENTSTAAQACSDCWTPIGPIVLSEFSYVTGSVRGLPSGLPLVGASVNLCAPVGGNPVGVCDFTVYADADGNFLLEAPSGSYNLLANATGYNSSVPLPVTLHAGQVLPLGTLFLEAFGTAQGAVISGATLLPVANASVDACEAWSGGACLPNALAAGDGTFLLGGPPGGYTLTVSAPGYVIWYGSETLTAGVTTVLTPIVLTPAGTATYYRVSGEVVLAAMSSQGLPGATVIAEVNGTPAFTATTAANGLFAFNVLYGSYELVAAAPGYAPATQAVVVDAPISGLVFSLPVMTYLFSGSVTDGLTGSPLVGVAIAENGTVQGVTDISGFVSFPLANGTHELIASDPASTLVSYGPVSFAVSVLGAPVVHDLQMDPPSELVRGTIVDADSGVPLTGVSVEIHGTTVDGVPVATSVSTSPQGVFTLTLTSGTYNASASATGYTARVVSFGVGPSTSPLTILMTPVPGNLGSHAAPSGGGVQWTLIAGVGLVVLVALLGTLLVVYRWRRPAPGRQVGGTRVPPP